MSDLEHLASKRLVIQHGDKYTTIRFRPSPSLCMTTVHIFITVYSLYLTSSLVFLPIRGVGSTIFVAVMAALALTMIFHGLRELFFDFSKGDKITITRDLFSIERFSIFGSGDRTLSPAAIESVSVVPDAFSRPFHGFPYRRKKHHVCLRYAGSNLALFKRLQHAEALTVAASIMHATKGLQLEDHATTPDVPANSNVFPLNDQSHDLEPNDLNRRVIIKDNEGTTSITLRPHLDIRRLSLLLIVIIFLVSKIISDNWGEDRIETYFYLASLLVFTLILPNFILNCFRREKIMISNGVVEDEILRGFLTAKHRYALARIQSIAVTETQDTIFNTADFERENIFCVSFDYGQTTREFGVRMSYREAQRLAEALSARLEARKEAA